MKLILHIGPDKTGTTTIQKFLDVNRDVLSKNGYLVPKSPGLKRHFKLYLYGFDDDLAIKEPVWKNREDTVEKFREVFRREFLAEIDKSDADSVILSDEGLYRMREHEIHRLKELLAERFEEITIFLYLRRQDEHVASRYQQVIKTGASILTFPDYVKGKHPYYNYNKVLSLWSGVFGVSNIVPRIFDREIFFGGNLIDDFKNFLGVEGGEGFSEVSSLNFGLDAACTEFLRLYKIFYKKETGRDLHPLSQDYSLIKFLEDNSTRQKLKLGIARRERFMLRWAKGNEEVAKTFFKNTSGQLFPPKEEAREEESEKLSPERAVELFFLARNGGFISK